MSGADALIEALVKIEDLTAKLSRSESARREAEADRDKADAARKENLLASEIALASERAAREAWEREFNVANTERLRLHDEVENLAERIGQFEAAGFPNVATVLDRVESERAARERAEAKTIEWAGARDLWKRQCESAESRLSRATEALRGAEAHHDEQARLWADNESDGEADLNAQYHSERRDVFTAVLAEVDRG